MVKCVCPDISYLFQMKNRNTKDVAENHIYSFILSNLFLFIGIFFSLNSAGEVAILFYILALNLFTNWLYFYSSHKKKLVHFSEYYNNLAIGIYCVAAIIPVFLVIVPLLLFPDISNSILLLIAWILAPIFNQIILKRYAWESKAEKVLNAYRMNIEEEKERAFEVLKSFIQESDKRRFSNYIEKSQLFDQKMEEYLEQK